MMIPRFLFVCCFLVSVCFGKEVRIGLETSWSHTPLLLEASEFFAGEGLFWDFLERVIDSDVSVNSTDEAQYTFALAFGEEFLHKDQKSLLQLFLSSRAFSPAVEMQRSLAVEDGAIFSDEKQHYCFARVCEKSFESVSELRSFLEGRKSSHCKRAHVIARDRAFGETSGDIEVVLYGSMGDASFQEFHQFLKKTKQPVKYFVRHFYPQFERRVRLSGFGVEMHVKSTEYKVVDDDEAGSKAGDGEAGDVLEPVPKNEVRSLGMGIAQTIANSDDPLESLEKLSQNFPTECHLYRKKKIDKSFLRKVQENQEKVRAGHTAILINGRHVNVENVNFFDLLNILSDEVKMSIALSNIDGMKAKTARSLVIRNTAKNQQLQAYYDLRSKHLRYMNDVEKDPMTSRWPPSLRALLRQQWPGTPYYVRRNVFTVVTVVDFSARGFDVLKDLLELWVNMGFCEEGKESSMGAIRLAILSVGKSHRSNLLTQAFNHFNDGAEAMRFLSRFYELIETDGAPPTDAMFERLLENTLVAVGSSMTVDRLSKTSGTQDSNVWCEKEFGIHVDALTEGRGYKMFVNGKEYDSSLGPMMALVHQAVMEQTNQIQMLVYRQLLSDSTKDIHGSLLDFFKASTSFSKYSMDPVTFVPFVVPEKARNLKYKEFVEKLQFSTSCTPFCSITHIAIVDLSSKEGRNLLKQAIARTKEMPRQIRMAVVPYGDKHASAQVLKLWSQGKMETLSDLVDSLETATTTEAETGVFGTLQTFFENFVDEFLPFSKEEHKAVLITNGRLVYADEFFSLSDFKCIEKNENTKRADEVAKILHLDHHNKAWLSNVIFFASSVLGMDEEKKIARHEITSFATPTVTIEAKNKTSTLVIDALLDPLSEGGKKFGSILLKILKLFDAEVNLVLNPNMDLSDLPLKQFYRYVAATSLTFRANGEIDSSQHKSAVFPNLPSQTLFSMSLDVPDSWMVDAVAAPRDLDNLRLADIQDEVVGAMYELTHLTVEGKCTDKSGSTEKNSVRGMQLRLERSSSHQSYETLVMENAGYFQLKSGPGLWSLSLKGRSDELYQISEDSEKVVVSDFSGSFLNLDVSRRPESSLNETLLPADPEADEKLKEYIVERKRAAKGKGKSKGLFSGIFGGSEGDATENLPTIKPSNDTINVFSLASGHLYERFLSIMIYTTVRSTKSPVKFWFLRQFLSPQFKRLLPKLAEKYGFDFELVTYNWPRWLRRQTVKQRTIWAYKILFLDVLFPLDVERVIFVDADQVVKEDLKKLHEMDLQGAPYAFTPFCSLKENRRIETKGFRFWESGYWKDTLGHLPYHISALFVVDLKRFRQIAAGDILRGSYNQVKKKREKVSTSVID